MEILWLLNVTYMGIIIYDNMGSLCPVERWNMTMRLEVQRHPIRVTKKRGGNSTRTFGTLWNVSYVLWSFDGRHTWKTYKNLMFRQKNSFSMPQQLTCRMADSKWNQNLVISRPVNAKHEEHPVRPEATADSAPIQVWPLTVHPCSSHG